MRYRVICSKLFKVKIYHKKYFGHKIFAIYGTSHIYNIQGALTTKSHTVFTACFVGFVVHTLAILLPYFF